MSNHEQCHFYVVRKKRYCRMTVKKGKQFCGEHQISCAEDIDIKERVVCPLDPKHSCYKTKLAKHLKVCNAQQLVNPNLPFVVKGINLGEEILVPTIDVPLSEIDPQVVETVIDKLNESFAKIPEIQEEIMCHKVLKKELVCNSGLRSKRHLQQIASLLGHLEKVNLIDENTCFIEFGAGTGKLTYWLGQCIKSYSNSSILLVDKSSHRHKEDNKLRNDEIECKITRVRANIADLKLENLSDINETVKKVGIAKHLCGAATDLTIRCLTNFMERCKHNKDIGLIIALCCHHSCDYRHYVGHDYLSSEGFDESDFRILCKIASWATCGMKKQGDVKYVEDRETTGFRVKTLLNYGRLKYLQSRGFNCKLVRYVSSETTLENVCIVAVNKQDEVIR